MKPYLILLSFLLISCGARKVNKSEVTENTTQKEVIDSTSKVNTITHIDTVIDDLVIEPIDTIKPIEITNSDGKVTKYKNAKISHRKVKDNTVIEKKEETAKKAVKSIVVAKKSNVKLVDKKQFDVIEMLLDWWWLILIIILAVYLIKKYGIPKIL